MTYWKQGKEEYEKRKLSSAQVTSGDKAGISPLNEKCVSKKEIVDIIPKRKQEEEVPDDAEGTIENPILMSDD